MVTLGALLADTPHTRPIPVTGTATEPDLVDRLKLEQSTYEGPTGIVGVFQDACVQLDIPAVSYWAAVPHYVAQPPCPKATLALLGQLEDLLECGIPLGDLPEDARAWERGVDELAEEDEDVADYVRALEETRDTADLPEASGEAIAREFERYLKRREDDERRDARRLRASAAASPQAPASERARPSTASSAPASRGRWCRPARRSPSVAATQPSTAASAAGRRGRRPARRAPASTTGAGGRAGAEGRAPCASASRVSTASQSWASVHSQSLR